MMCTKKLELLFSPNPEDITSDGEIISIALVGLLIISQAISKYEAYENFLVLSILTTQATPKP